MDISSSQDENQRTEPTGPSHPYLRLASVDVFVRDLERSRQFYVDKLGFGLAFEFELQSGRRAVGVAPHEGTAVLTLVRPEPDSPEHKLIGRSTRVMFVTEDVTGTYMEWSARGVRFRHAPRLRRIKYRKQSGGSRPSDATVTHGDQAPIWGGIFTRFEDVDGNVFTLASFDEVSKALEVQRREAAEKRDVERRAGHELDMARQVQARLFPQSLPTLKTLEYAGTCAQAKQVGGDYFDFLALSRDNLALVLGDIAGKGMPAALLMANLQANLRSQSIVAIRDPRRFLTSVNELFYRNTEVSAYSTLFFAEYSDKTRRLRYVNCGHLSALLLRSDDRVEWLESTCTVLGLFPAWDCSTGQCRLTRGDLLVIFTDGITEACNHGGEEFGEEGVLASVRAHRELAPGRLMEAILSEVRSFSAYEQQDDMTLVVARCTS